MTTEEDQIAALRDRIDRLERGSQTAQAALLMLSALLLGSGPAPDQRRIMLALRLGSPAILAGMLRPDDSEEMALLCEELLAQLLDNTERLAETYRASQS